MWSLMMSIDIGTSGWEFGNVVRPLIALIPRLPINGRYQHICARCILNASFGETVNFIGLSFRLVLQNLFCINKRCQEFQAQINILLQVVYEVSGSENSVEIDTGKWFHCINQKVLSVALDALSNQ